MTVDILHAGAVWTEHVTASGVNFFLHVFRSWTNMFNFCIPVKIPTCIVIPRLHDQAIIKQTSSNLSTHRARVFWMHLLDVCSIACIS